MSIYSEWVSAKDIPLAVNLEHVLKNYPFSVGRTVVSSIVKSIVEGHSGEASLSLTTHEEVSWTMQVLGHGLTLPLQDYTIIRHCVDIYSEWLHAAVSRRIDKKSVPLPLIETPEHYIGVIFMQYFSSLFEEKGAEGNLLYHQVNLCQSVLEITRGVLQEVKLSTQTWTTIMKSLLKVADSLLSPPTEPKSLGDQLSDNLVFVIFDLWICMSCTAFPPPSLWKALRESCVLWRHHPEVVQEWSALIISLTKMVIRLLYGPDNCLAIRDPKSAYAESVKRLSNDALVQCWFRMLHTIGNPVELSYPLVIERSAAFQQHRTQQQYKGPFAHPCLENLKDIFHKAMTCVSTLVDMFLSVNPVYQEKPRPPVRESSSQQSSPMISQKYLAATHQDLGKAYPSHMQLSAGRLKSPVFKTPSNPLAASSHSQLQSLSASSGDIPRSYRSALLAGSDPDKTDGPYGFSQFKTALPSKPKGYTLLHLFGSWLFEAVIWHNSLITMKSPLAIQFEEGRAVALGTMCRVFCSLSPQDTCPPIYTARFYQSLSIGLDYDVKVSQGYFLASVILNSTDLFRIGLPGVNSLIVYYLKALGLILCNDHIQLRCKQDWSQIRSASVQLLLSLLPLPLHFQEVTVPNLAKFISQSSGSKLKGSTPEEQTDAKEPPDYFKFISLRNRLNRLLIHALDSEKDSSNMQILLGGLMSTLEDSVMFENSVLMMDKAAKKPSAAFSEPPDDTIIEDEDIQVILSDHSGSEDSKMGFVIVGGSDGEEEDDSCRTDGPRGDTLNQETGNDDEAGTKTSKQDDDYAHRNAKQEVYTQGSLKQEIKPHRSLKQAEPHRSSKQATSLESNMSAALSSLKRPPKIATVTTLDKHFTQVTVALFHKAITTAQNCLLKWDGDFPVAMASFTLLCSLAKLKIDGCPVGDETDSKRVIRLLCNYIEKNAEKPTRDNHTMLVAAFWSILQWVIARPELINDKNILGSVFAVVELGLSGSTSEKVNPDGTKTVIHKGEKEIKPLSGRSRQMAEYLLICLMEKIGVSTVSHAGQSTLDEAAILSKLPSGTKIAPTFQYFVIDNGYILGLLEDSPLPSADKLPQLTLIVRSPSGSHVWSMEMRHRPHSEMATKGQFTSAPRPPYKEEVESVPLEPRRPWPEEVDQRQRVNADDSIPDISKVVDPSAMEEMTKKVAEQCEKEDELAKKFKTYLENLLYPDPSIAVEPPKAKDHLHTARLFLTHFGYLELDSLTNKDKTGGIKNFSILNSSSPSFQSALKTLDNIPTRYTNSVYILYIKDGQSRVQDILSNMSLSDKNEDFKQFLNGLGWVVDPASHFGFKGKLHPISDHGSGDPKPLYIDAQIPFKPFVYFANLNTEVAFVLPTLKQSKSLSSSSSLRSVESSDVGPEIQDHEHTPTLTRPRQGSGVSESSAMANASIVPEGTSHFKPSKEPPELSHHKSSKKQKRSQDCAVMVVWLENLSDMAKFPHRQLTSSLHGLMFPPPVPSSTRQLFDPKKYYQGQPYLPVIFVYPLPAGMYRIHTWIPAVRHAHVGPLIDGMVVSRRVLPSLVRQTAINICTMYRVDCEDLKTPSALRRQKIEEISSEFSKKLTPWELYTEIFAKGST